MDACSDLDTSSKSGYESGQESTSKSNCDVDEVLENVEPEFSEPLYDEYEDDVP